MKCPNCRSEGPFYELPKNNPIINPNNHAHECSKCKTKFTERLKFSKEEPTEEGMKFDGQGEDGSELKNRWSLLPWREINEVVKILTMGAVKYKDDNWKKVAEEKPKRYIDALQRHFYLWHVKKEKYDKDLYKRFDIKVSHLACLICNAIFLLWKDNEDRKEKPKKESNDKE